jgi:hypothetical protein
VTTTEQRPQQGLHGSRGTCTVRTATAGLDGGD